MEILTRVALANYVRYAIQLSKSMSGNLNNDVANEVVWLFSRFRSSMERPTHQVPTSQDA
jgi:hypothetical protein